MPAWLTTLSWISLALGLVCALLVLGDIMFVARQKMWIMDVVWPITALYAGPLGLWAYFSIGRLSTKTRTEEAKQSGDEPPGKTKPFWQMVARGVHPLRCRLHAGRPLSPNG